MFLRLSPDRHEFFLSSLVKNLRHYTSLTFFFYHHLIPLRISISFFLVAIIALFQTSTNCCIQRNDSGTGPAGAPSIRQWIGYTCLLHSTSTDGLQASWSNEIPSSVYRASKALHLSPQIPCGEETVVSRLPSYIMGRAWPNNFDKVQ